MRTKQNHESRKEMAYANTRLDNEQRRLLKALIGMRLEAIHFHAATGEFCAWEWVWLEFEDRIIEVSNGLEAVEYYGPDEEVSVFRVRQVESIDPNKHLDGKPVRRFAIGEIVNDVFLVEDERFRHHGEELIDTFVVTDAIVLKMESQDICIKKTIWFSEMADIDFGPNFMELLNDVTYDFDDADKEAEDGNALSARRIVQGVGSFDPLVVIETQKGGCPE